MGEVRRLRGPLVDDAAAVQPQRVGGHADAVRVVVVRRRHRLAEHQHGGRTRARVVERVAVGGGRAVQQQAHAWRPGHVDRRIEGHAHLDRVAEVVLPVRGQAGEGDGLDLGRRHVVVLDRAGGRLRRAEHGVRGGVGERHREGLVALVHRVVAGGDGDGPGRLPGEEGQLRIGGRRGVVRPVRVAAVRGRRAVRRRVADGHVGRRGRAQRHRERDRGALRRRRVRDGQGPQVGTLRRLRGRRSFQPVAGGDHAHRVVGAVRDPGDGVGGGRARRDGRFPVVGGRGGKGLGPGPPLHPVAVGAGHLVPGHVQLAAAGRQDDPRHLGRRTVIVDDDDPPFTG